MKAIFGKNLSFVMAFKKRFTDLIRYSEIPPIEGLTGWLKVIVILF